MRETPEQRAEREAIEARLRAVLVGHRPPPPRRLRTVADLRWCS